MCQQNFDGTMTLCDGDCPHKQAMQPRDRMAVRNGLDNPWNNPHHPGQNGVAVLEAYQSTEAGHLAATHAVYPNNRPPPERAYQPEGENPDPLSPHVAHSMPMTADHIVRQLERIAGILMTHEESFDQYRLEVYPAAAGLAPGSDLTNLAQSNTVTELGFNAKSVIIDNPSGYTLWIPGAARLIPPATFGYVVQLFPATSKLRLQVLSGTSVAATVFCIATERRLEQTPAYVGNLPGTAAPAALADATANPTVNSFGAEQMVFNGATWDRLRTPNVFKPITALSITAEATIWTPAAGKKFRLMGMLVEESAAANVTLRDNTGGTTIFVLTSAAGGNGTPVVLGNGILSAAVNNVLTAQGSVAGTLSGTVWGTEE